MSPVSHRKIIHVDMDCFFAAVEMRDNPDIAHRPIAVGGSPEDRGVVSTCNYAARKYGVRSAMSMHYALSLCPDLMVMPVRMSVYREVSAQIREIFLSYTDIIEPLSLDEAYLDVSDSDLCKGSASWIAESIRRDIFATTGLTASAGVSSCKLIAKIASDINKPNGLCVVPPERIPQFIQDMPLSKIPGVGSKTYTRLKDLGLRTCLDASNAGEELLGKHFGKFGHSLWRRCQGIDDRPVETVRIRKSVGAEHTLTNDIHTSNECLQVVESLLPKLNSRFEAHSRSSRVKSVKVKIKFSDFELVSAEKSSDSLDLSLVPELIDRLLERQGGRGIRLVGLSVGISPIEDEPQLKLL